MKLVQLLAKELKEWPEGVTNLTQSEVDYEIYDGLDGNKEDSAEPLDERFYASRSHSEGPYPMVTRDQWQAEREKMNKPKWIRHRGGWMPVGAATIVEVRLRCGDIQKHEACEFLWRHKDCYFAANIMAYRVIEETKDQEIEEVKCTNLGTLTYNIEVDTSSAMTAINELSAKWGQIESPLKWRDEIIELEAYEEEFRREREKLIRKLESEGLKLIDHMAPVYGFSDIDFSDWRNWQVGDVFVADGRCQYYTKGKEYVVKSLVDDDAPIKAIDDYGDVFCLHMNEVKFIHRP